MPDRIAIITGAGKGIGKAIAERLSADGFYVALVDVDQAAMEEAVAIIGADKATGYLVDITNENQVKALFENIENAKNKIDLLVNNAGIIRDNLIWNLSANDFDAVINVNLKGTWLMCREAAIRMKQQKYGCIVNIASRAWLGNAGQTNYSASKAGIIGLTRSLALEMGRHNVSVNAIAPGLIDTPLTQKLDKDVLDKLIQAQPSRSMGKPEDIANVVSFLASEKTSFMTGQTIYVDGGKSIGAGL
ncbi:MAG TPA: 3-oxoacyl-ACP reductase FabG [Bacteroidia bacterium]|nr:3-oxoacyl-ACP reductase FabG [Bacteroidia bacterium]OQA11733.1 MAG: 3-oxoacyl-(acyl-carrier-protein) reductase FabG [Bacteroidetes bacterium ADurb.Bin397]HOZ82146.1 3-oxoacyl-ACP reductase FabG [Bacteroidia bacterium]HOZ90376.1 3-oxoacyl-ACP reductase FabG [Bacteroidia bacterium]HQW17606.1 3-oxoacyl-ACP reductase FabG [Bacteroidia bacterium]